MNTVELFVKNGDEIAKILADLKQSGVKYYPVNKVSGGWKLEMENHPIVSFLIIKYGLEA